MSQPPHPLLRSGAPHRRSSAVRAAVLQLVLLIFTESATAAERAQRQSVSSSPSAALLALRAAGLKALASGHDAEAARSLAAAYRLHPDASGLALLLSLAWAQGCTQAAKDLARRYLAEATEPSTPADQASRLLSKRVLSLPAEPAGELSVLGPAGAWVLVDNRLAGSLPLSRALWIAAGAHPIVIERGATRWAVTATVPPHSTLELRLDEELGAAVLTRLPSLAVLTPKEPLPAELATPLEQAIATAAQRENIARLPAAAAQTTQAPADCQDSLACLDDVAKQRDATYVLAARLQVPSVDAAPAARGSLELRLFSRDVGELGAERTLACPGCAPRRRLEQYTQTLVEMLALAGTRPRGELVLLTDPPGAAVWSGGQRLGTTPYRRAAWTGSRRLELRREGHLPWSVMVTIEEGRAASLSIALKPAKGGEARAAAGAAPRVRCAAAPPSHRGPRHTRGGSAPVPPRSAGAPRGAGETCRASCRAKGERS